MSEFAYCYQGASTGDNPRFVKFFWEQPIASQGFEYFQNPAEQTVLHGGKQNIVDWSGVTSFEGAAVRGEQAWTRRGIAIGQMRSLPATIYEGNHFSNSTPVIVPSKDTDLSALWCYCSSAEFARAVRAINQKLSVDNGYVSKIHLDIERWRKEAADRFPMGVPRAHSNAADQWIFHGHPCGLVVWDDEKKKLEHEAHRTDSTVLHVAVARLLGYRWPGEVDRNMEFADEHREWVEKVKILYTFADEDGIVCIPSVRGKRPSHERVLQILMAAWADDWLDSIPVKLLHGDGSSSLDDWLRNKFFEEHCMLFQQRPFIWHIWDGRMRDGFHALGQLPQAGRRRRRGRGASWSRSHTAISASGSPASRTA